MKYIFFGTPRFAAIILEKLIEAGLIPEAVICNPDKPIGRKKIPTSPAVKQLILDKKIKTQILQPAKLSSSEDDNLLKQINADIFIVAAYNKIIPEKIINIPKFKTIGVHPSLLPKYRGASPIQTAILNGDKETGIDIFLIDKEIDHGPILASDKCEILEKDNYETLEAKLAELGAELLIENLPKYLSGKLKAKEQDHSKATFTKKFSTEDGCVELPPQLCHSALDAESRNLDSRFPSFAKGFGRARRGNDKTREDSPELIFNKIRALNPDPGVFTFIKTKSGEKRVKLLEARIIKDETLRQAQDKLELLKVQPEGKKPMSYKDFQNGNI